MKSKIPSFITNQLGLFRLFHMHLSTGMAQHIISLHSPPFPPNRRVELMTFPKSPGFHSIVLTLTYIQKFRRLGIFLKNDMPN
jgi:hypothetical protein